jgi:hypothetical protein
MDDADERAEERDLPDWLLPAHRVTPADALRRIQALCLICMPRCSWCWPPTRPCRAKCWRWR